MKKVKKKHLTDYVYIRLSKSIKEGVSEVAEKNGMNMTIWIRNLIIRELASQHE